MGWEVLIPLIIKYGLPLAESIFQKWSAGTPPTQKDFDDLKALASLDATAQAKSVIASLGLSETDAKAQAILALVK